MKKIDWSKAPEGATHYNKDCACPWLKESPPSYFVEDMGDWVGYGAQVGHGAWVRYANARTHEVHLKNAVKRPQEWDGSGVPPIGTECEFMRAAHKTCWTKVKVVFIGKKLIVLEHGVSGNEFTVRIDEVSFRLIKTPEQIAGEERQQAIEEMVSCVSARCDTFKDVMGVLYDAGYRKTEKGSNNV